MRKTIRPSTRLARELFAIVISLFFGGIIVLTLILVIAQRPEESLIPSFMVLAGCVVPVCLMVVLLYVMIDSLRLRGCVDEVYFDESDQSLIVVDTSGEIIVPVKTCAMSQTIGSSQDRSSS